MPIHIAPKTYLTSFKAQCSILIQIIIVFDYYTLYSMSPLLQDLSTHVKVSSAASPLFYENSYLGALKMGNQLSQQLCIYFHI